MAGRVIREDVPRLFTSTPTRLNLLGRRRPIITGFSREICVPIRVRELAGVVWIKGLRSSTFTTLFGLLVATGMRVSEALNLDRPDVDFDRGILHVQRTKFGKSRYVPVHPSTLEALRKYAEARGRLFPTPLIPAFFVSERGGRITGATARYTFAKLSQQLGLRASIKGHGRGPRLHDMRHRFAVRTLIHCYRSGLDVERELPKLATYLGHVHVNESYWYLEAVPELLQLATDRLIAREVQP